MFKILEERLVDLNYQKASNIRTLLAGALDGPGAVADRKDPQRLG
jgi:hypothetical protein